MLKEMIAAGFGQAEDYNCAEKIFYGANEAYGLGLSEDDLRLAAGFGGGMAIESACGALCGGVMAISRLLVEKNAHAAKELKPRLKSLFQEFEEEMGSIQCSQLKKDYRTPEKKCQVVIEKAAEILDRRYAEIRKLKAEAGEGEVHDK